tara:strand:- start:7046 stop:7195 length:150 start_codon:yes stop_codon:yes gene_type:complete
MYTIDNLVFAVISGFFGYPILKFLVLAVIEKIVNDTDKEFEHFNINDDK